MNQHTLTVLEILHAAALTKSDPKPALRHISTFCPETGLLAIRVADEIETRFSQSDALRASELPEITEKDISLLREFEAQDKLAAGYERLFEEISQRELSAFWKGLKEKETLKKGIDTAFQALIASATTQTLKNAYTEMRSSLLEDGASLKNALRKSPAIAKLSTKAAAIANQTQNWAERSTAQLETLQRELDKRHINWKVAAGIIGGAILGSLLTRKKTR